MPKLVLSFKLPEEQEDYEVYRKGREMYNFMFEWIQQAERKLELDSKYDVLDDLNNQLSINNIHPIK